MISDSLTRRRQVPSWLVAVVCLPSGLFLAARLGTEFYHSFVRQVYVGPSDPLATTLGGAAFGLGLISVGALSLRTAVTRRPLAPAGRRFLRAGTWMTIGGLALMIIATAMLGHERSRSDILTRPMVRSLHDLADAESLFYAERGTYTADLVALDSVTRWRRRGHSAAVVTAADSTAWSANAWSSSITRTCWMSVRRVRGRASEDGPWCTKQWDFKPR